MRAMQIIDLPPLTLHVFVPGRPAPQGSKTRTRFAMRDANAGTLHPWRDAVRVDVAANLPGVWTPVAGPVEAHLTFTLPKPASAPKRRRTWPIGQKSGDLDKLVRACCDAITDAGWWRDDSQVVALRASKDYGARPGVDIFLSEFREGLT